MAKEFENAFIQNLEGSVIKERSAEGANDKMAELLSRQPLSIFSKVSSPVR